MPDLHDDREHEDHVEEDLGGAHDEAAHEALRRIVAGAMSAPTMKRFAAAAALLFAGKRGRDMRAPEPLVEVGFEIREEEMALLVATAERSGRDLVHVGCHADGSGKPMGMIAVVYFEDGVARPHRRCGLVCAPGSSQVLLAGVSDIEDETCRFHFTPDGKMRRIAGYPLDDLADQANRAGEMWFERAGSLDPVECEGEAMRLYELLEADDHADAADGDEPSPPS